MPAKIDFLLMLLEGPQQGGSRINARHIFSQLNNRVIAPRRKDRLWFRRLNSYENTSLDEHDSMNKEEQAARQAFCFSNSKITTGFIQAGNIRRWPFSDQSVECG